MGTGKYWLKMGADSPENFLAFHEFDGTTNLGGIETPGLQNGLHRYEDHKKDWNPGDPTWRGGKGKAIIGALNYLASQSVNSLYAITYNIDGGDGADTWPWIEPNSESSRFDVSKLEQWTIVLDHMNNNGINFHWVTQEMENDKRLGRNGKLNDHRKLYYKELLARIGHLPAMTINLGEENQNEISDVANFAEWISQIDAYKHPISIHTWFDEPLEDYGALLAAKKGNMIQMTSIQGHGIYFNDWAKELRERSSKAGHKWVIMMDEQAPEVKADLGNLDVLRRSCLWSQFLGGGSGIEWYFGYQGTFGDVQSKNFRIVQKLWKQSKIAVDLMYELPFTEMKPENTVVVNDKGLPTYAFMKPGSDYLLHFPDGIYKGITKINLQGHPGKYKIVWVNPRTGDQQVASGTISGRAWRNLGTPDVEKDAYLKNDWVCLVRKK